MYEVKDISKHSCVVATAILATRNKKGLDKLYLADANNVINKSIPPSPSARCLSFAFTIIRLGKESDLRGVVGTRGLPVSYRRIYTLVPLSRLAFYDYSRSPHSQPNGSPMTRTEKQKLS